MATGTILDMFSPQSAEVIGTMRTQRIADDPYTEQIRNAGMSVLDAMLTGARDKVVEIASGTQIGQSFIQEAKRQEVQNMLGTWGPLLLIALVGVGIMAMMMLRRR